MFMFYKKSRYFIFLFFIVFVTLSGVFFGYSVVRAQSAPTSTATSSPNTAPNIQSVQDQRKQLEDQLAQLEAQQSQYEKTIETYQGQGNTLKNDIAILNAKISKIKVQIKALDLTIIELGQQINDTQGQINHTENSIDQNKQAIADAIKGLYEADQQTLLSILLANNKLSDFFGNVTDVMLVQHNVQVSLDEIIKLRQTLIEQEQQLNSQKSDVENLKSIQLSQQQTALQTQQQKNTVLKDTKGKESVYQQLLQKTQETAAQIRNRLFELLGGGQLTFQKAYDYAKVAGDAVGVRPALILAILDRESLFGKNVGKCSYTTAMSPTRDIPYFLQLLAQLGIDPNSDSAMVSCPNQHGTYGGAMGPAQFIPSTWKLYSDAISHVTGDTPANPWNNSDAFTATALFMKDLINSASCQQYASANQNIAPFESLVERCAAAKYYAGGSWYTYRFWYGEPVVERADQFDKDISVLNQTASQ